MNMELGNMMFGNSRGEYPVERLDRYYYEFERLFNAYAPDRNNLWREYGVEFENDTFWVFPYYWGDCTCGAEGDEYCTNECLLVKPNFYHKPTGFKLSWYKYPLRDSYSNEPVTMKLLQTIIDDCIASLEPTE